MPVETKIVYISIGNSDDKLSQSKWSQYWFDINSEIESLAYQIHGVWFSANESPYQNAAWCVELNDYGFKELKEALIPLRAHYDQDSIAWAVAETELI